MMDLTRRRIWFAVFVLVVFTTGLGGGVVLDRYFTVGRPPAFGRGPGGPLAPGRFGGPRPAEIVERLSRDLELTSDQRARLQAIFERSAERMATFQAGTRKEFEQLRRQLDAEIAAILTPDQRKKFEEEHRWRRVREPRPPGGEPRRPPFPE